MKRIPVETNRHSSSKTIQTSVYTHVPGGIFIGYILEGQISDYSVLVQNRQTANLKVQRRHVDFTLVHLRHKNLN